MATLEQTLFGPLDSGYCLYFYYLSIFGFAFLILFVISSLWIGISKKLGFKFYSNMFVISLIYFVFYFQNRLLYSMCSK